MVGTSSLKKSRVKFTFSTCNKYEIIHFFDFYVNDKTNYLQQEFHSREEKKTLHDS